MWKPYYNASMCKTIILHVFWLWLEGGKISVCSKYAALFRCNSFQLPVASKKAAFCFNGIGVSKVKKIFQIDRKECDTIIRLLGIKFKIKNKHKAKDLNTISRISQENLKVYSLHQKTFPQFKNTHLGQDIVIFASGPSANKYRPLLGAFHIGINRSFETSKQPLDYLFIQDYTGKTSEYIDAADSYEPQRCTKFYGIIRENVFDKTWTVPESHAIKAEALRYRTDWTPYYEPEFAFDLSTQALGDFGSTVFSALQFALWTHPKKIYLVGCDCTTTGYADKKHGKNILNTDKVISAFKQFKKFAQKHYPDIEIISINPVGLKGIFKDEYMGE